MKLCSVLSCLSLLAVLVQPPGALAVGSHFDSFLSRFDYDVRDDMKIDSKGLVRLLENGRAILVDVRFKEEVAAWRTGVALNIPLNELPKRIDDLPKDKIIVAACPHKDRSAIAMAYLRSKGFDAKYLTDGLIGFAELLRGERAKEFMETLDRLHSHEETKTRKERNHEN